MVAQYAPQMADRQSKIADTPGLAPRERTREIKPSYL